MAPVAIQTAWEIYADQLAMLGHGIALWQPAPLDNYERVNIGDVGYIRRGHFHLLFSAALPLGDRVPGVHVPKKFVPLNVGLTFKGQPRLPGALHTEDIKQTGVGISASSELAFIDAGATFSFESESKKGAILLTKFKTYSEDAERMGHFREYILQHYNSWLEFANEGGHGLNLEDIIFVTGHDMTKDFAMAAFSANGRNLDIKFEAGLPAVACVSASVWGMWRTTMSVHHNCGPQHREPPPLASDQPMLIDLSSGASDSDSSTEYDQCVFLRAFRIRKRAGLFPTLLKAVAGPHDPGSTRFDENGTALVSESRCSSEGDVVAVSDASSFVDPLDPVFQYIFQTNADADTALVHDLDVSDLFKLNAPRAGEALQEFLSRISPETVGSNGVGSLKQRNQSDLEHFPIVMAGLEPRDFFSHGLLSDVDTLQGYLPMGAKGQLEEIHEDSSLISLSQPFSYVEYPQIYPTHSPYGVSPIIFPHPGSPPINPLKRTDGLSDFPDSSTSSSRSMTSSSEASSAHSSLFIARRSHRFNPMGVRAKSVDFDSDESNDTDRRPRVTSSTDATAPSWLGLTPGLAHSRREDIRRQRIESEQRRRDELRAGYGRLRDALPVSSQARSKVSLLDCAVAHIKNLEAVNQQLQTSLEQAEARNVH